MRTNYNLEYWLIYLGAGKSVVGCSFKNISLSVLCFISKYSQGFTVSKAKHDDLRRQEKLFFFSQIVSEIIITKYLCKMKATCFVIKIRNWFQTHSHYRVYEPRCNQFLFVCWWGVFFFFFLCGCQGGMVALLYSSGSNLHTKVAR